MWMGKNHLFFKKSAYNFFKIFDLMFRFWKKYYIVLKFNIITFHIFGAKAKEHLDQNLTLLSRFLFDTKELFCK